MIPFRMFCGGSSGIFICRRWIARHDVASRFGSGPKDGEDTRQEFPGYVLYVSYDWISRRFILATTGKSTSPSWKEL